MAAAQQQQPMKMPWCWSVVMGEQMRVQAEQGEEGEEWCRDQGGDGVIKEQEGEDAKTPLMSYPFSQPQSTSLGPLRDASAKELVHDWVCNPIQDWGRSAGQPVRYPALGRWRLEPSCSKGVCTPLL